MRERGGIGACRIEKIYFYYYMPMQLQYGRKQQLLIEAMWAKSLDQNQKNLKGRDKKCVKFSLKLSLVLSQFVTFDYHKKLSMHSKNNSLATSA